MTMFVDYEHILQASFEVVKGRPPDIQIDDSPIFSSSSKLYQASWWKKDDGEYCSFICAYLPERLCSAETFPDMMFMIPYGKEVAKLCAKKRLGIIIVITVKEDILSFNTPLDLILVVRRGDGLNTLKFDCANEPTFWCEVPWPEGVDMVQGLVVL